MKSGGSESRTWSASRSKRWRSPGSGALAALAVLVVTGAAAPPFPGPPSAPPQAATEGIAKPGPAAVPDGAAKPDETAATEAAAKAEAASRGAIDLFGTLIGIGTYGTAFTAVTQGAMSAATGAIGLAAAAGAAAGVIWAGYGPGDENTNYWNLVPAGLGALGGIVVGEAVAFGLLGYSPFGVGVAGYVPLTSLTFSRYAHSAYAYMTGILGAKAALGLYGAETPGDGHRDNAVPTPVAAPPPTSALPAQLPPGEDGS